MIDYYMVYIGNISQELPSSLNSGLTVRSDLEYGYDEHLKLAII